jgi:hypothetical protein
LLVISILLCSAHEMKVENTPMTLVIRTITYRQLLLILANIRFPFSNLNQNILIEVSKRDHLYYFNVWKFLFKLISNLLP